MAIDLADTFIQAMDTIVKERTSQLEYDKTIIATITDNSNANRGYYSVSDGDAVYVAYTDNTEYDVGDTVYITVPTGDYSRQKMIVGKYVGNSTTSYYNYSSPWKKFIDVTGDLVDDDSIVSSSILANGKTTAKVLWENNDIESGDDYTRIGIKADFKTCLGSFGTTFGTYGLKLYVTYFDNATQSTSAVKFQLDNTDMYGNPYNFETFYNQNKTFDISGLDKIIGMKLVLFQDANFTTVDKTLIGTTYSNTDGNIVKTGTLDDNIILQNIYVALGYNLDEFDHDVVLLYSPQAKTYSVDDNARDLKVRWIHKDTDTDQVVCYSDFESIANIASLHWYKYNMSRGVVDKWAGTFWEEVENNKNLFSITTNLKITKQSEAYKVIIETPLYDDLLLEAASTEEDIASEQEKLNLAKQAYESAQNSFTAVSSDTNYSKYITAKTYYENEQAKFDKLTAAYLTDLQLYESNALEFTNEQVVADESTVNLIAGLSLDCDTEGYKGIYYLYNSSNEIINKKEASTQRKIIAQYNALNTEENILDSAGSITWRIPLVNTMIQAPQKNIEYDLTVDTYNLAEDNSYCEITRTVSATGTLTLNGYTGISAEQIFRIKDYYAANATNNTITCIVDKDGTKYSASVDLQFGPTGTNGTDYTFMLKMQADRNCICETEDPIKITAQLLDGNNLFVDLSQYTITYDWYSGNIINGSTDKEISYPVILCEENGNRLGNSANNKISQTGANNDTVYVKWQEVTETILPKFTILHAAISIDGVTSAGIELKNKTTLDAYLPIPYSSNPEVINHIDGSDRIIYNVGGTCEIFYRNPYKAYDSFDQLLENVTWDIETSTDADKNYLPSITADGQLIPTTNYISGTNKRIAITATVEAHGKKYIYSQPLFIYQDVYTSQLLNSWDGSLTIDEENGTIMSTMLGAGYKDSQNRYNGVLMGDVKSSADGYAGTGVYGYNAGEQSFGLDISGTAFFGKAGRGRIEMDGNTGIIKSMSYDSDATGMAIDLDDGYIDILGSKYLPSISAIDDSIESEDDFDLLSICQTLRTKYQDLLNSLDSQLNDLNIIDTSTINQTVYEINTAKKKYSHIIEILDKCIDLCNLELYPIYIKETIYDKDITYYSLFSSSSEYVSATYVNSHTCPKYDYYVDTMDEPKVKVTKYLGSDENYYKIKITKTYAEITDKLSYDYIIHKDCYYKKEKITYEDLLNNIDICEMLDYYSLKLSEIFTDSLVTNTKTYEKTRSQVYISALNPYFSIKSGTDNNTELLRISDEAYFIQSDGYVATTWMQDSNKKWIIDTDKSLGKGLFLDLKNGQMLAHDFRLQNVATDDTFAGSYVLLQSHGDPYLQIHYKQFFNNEKYLDLDDITRENDLLYIGYDNYYLQSATWNGDNNALDLTEKTGMKLDLLNGSLTAYDNFTLYAENKGLVYNPTTGYYVSNDKTKDYIGSHISISSTGNPFLQIYYVYTPSEGTTGYYNNDSDSAIELSTVDQTLLDIENQKFVLTSADYGLYRLEKDADNITSCFVKKGLKIDLTDGSIDAYQFDLLAYHAADNNEIIRVNSTSKKSNVDQSAISAQEAFDYNPLYIGQKNPIMYIGAGTIDQTSFNNRTENLYYLDSNKNYILAEYYNSSITNYYKKVVTDSDDGTTLVFFTVGWDGSVTMKNIYATSGGMIGPFNISSEALWAGDGYNGTNGMYLGAKNGKFTVRNGGAGLVIDDEGNAYLTGDIYLGGTIYGENWTLHGYFDSGGGGSGGSSGSSGGAGGQIAGWTIDAGQIASESGAAVLYADGRIHLSNTFRLEETVLFANLSGTIDLASGMSSLALHNGTTTISGNNFKVDESGDTTVGHLQVKDTFVTLGKNGLFVAATYYFSNSGALKCETIAGSSMELSGAASVQSLSVGGKSLDEVIQAKIDAQGFKALAYKESVTVSGSLSGSDSMGGSVTVSGSLSS